MSGANFRALMNQIPLSTQSTLEDVMRAKSSDKPIILVMGCDEYRSTVAKLLVDTPSISEIYSVVDSGTFSATEDGAKAGSLRRVRKWISAKYIRRLYGHKINVVWAFSTNTLEGQSAMTFAKQIGIAHTMFDSGKKDLVIAVMEESKTGLDAVQRNFVNVVPHYEQSSYLSQAPFMLSLIKNAKPLEIPAQVSIQAAGIPTAWSSENVLLFGRTGSGKSTVARMLTRGNLEDSSIFVSGSGARGVTLNVTREDGRGWRVTDTPGFGEVKTGAVSTQEATEKLRTFMSKIGGLYAHYAYVVRYNRIDDLDERLWKFFVSLTPNANDNLSVIVTCCEKGLTKKEEDDLHKRFKGSKSVTWVNFKTLADEYKTEKIIAITKKRAKDSLERLEKELADTRRTEAECCRFNISQDARDNYEARGGKRFVCLVGNNSSMKFVHDVANKCIVEPLRYVVSSVTGEGKIDESFILLPE